MSWSPSESPLVVNSTSLLSPMKLGSSTSTPRMSPSTGGPSKKVTSPDGDGGESSGDLAAAKNLNVAGCPSVLGLLFAVSAQCVVKLPADAGGENGPRRSAPPTRVATKALTMPTRGSPAMPAHSRTWVLAAIDRSCHGEKHPQVVVSEDLRHGQTGSRRP
jgi:hypothetical protein